MKSVYLCMCFYAHIYFLESYYQRKKILESLTCVGKREVQIAASMYIVFIAKFTCINRIELNYTIKVKST